MDERRHIVAFLTGQSDPLSNALSDCQRGFLTRCGLVDEEVIPWNFPYDPSLDVRSEVPLWLASWNNIRMYLRSGKASFAERHRGEVERTFSGYGRVILIAGSCGLELLANLRMPDSFLGKTWVFALGPVSRSVPVCAGMSLVQGRRDLISKCWHRRVDHVVPCGHMDYLECPEVAERFMEFYREARGS